MKTFDRILLIVGTLVLAGMWYEGAHRAAEGDPEDRLGGYAGVTPILGRGGAEGGSVATMGLPAGLRVDPATGLLVGVVPPDIPGTKPLTWETLRSYEYRPGLEGLPDEVKAYDGQKVVMIGFLMTVFQYDDIDEFHLVASHWSCCYGVPPGLEGAVAVKLKKGEEGLPNTIKPLRVIGTLRIAEVKEAEIVYAIYSIGDAEALIMDY